MTYKRQYKEMTRKMCIYQKKGNNLMKSHEYRKWDIALFKCIQRRYIDEIYENIFQESFVEIDRMMTDRKKN